MPDFCRHSGPITVLPSFPGPSPLQLRRMEQTRSGLRMTTVVYDAHKHTILMGFRQRTTAHTYCGMNETQQSISVLSIFSHARKRDTSRHGAALLPVACDPHQHDAGMRRGHGLHQHNPEIALIHRSSGSSNLAPPEAGLVPSYHLF